MDNEDNTTVTNNDDLQSNPGDVNPMADMKDNQELEEDNNTPFSPPDGAQDRIGDTFPATDTNVDSTEHYQEGIEGAAGVDMPGQAAEEEDNDNMPDTPAQP